MPDTENRIVLPDGSVLPPGYVPRGTLVPPQLPTPPPNGQSWADWNASRRPPED